MVGHVVLMSDELLDAQPRHHATTRHDAHHPEAAKEMQRARQITQEETNGEEIEEYPEGPRNPVVRSPTFAVHILDRHFADGCAVPRCERRDKAVQLAIKRNLLQDVSAICLERSPKIMNIDAADFRHHPV